MAARVRIVETGAVFEAPEGEDLLEVLQRNGYPIATSCGGVASCGLCRVTIAGGKENLTPIRSEELTHLGNVAKVIGTRLACQSKVVGTGEIAVSVPEVEDVEERKRRKSLKMRAERAQRRQSSHSFNQGEGPDSRPLSRPLSRPDDSAGPASSPASSSTPNSSGVIEWRPRLVPPKREG